MALALHDTVALNHWFIIVKWQDREAVLPGPTRTKNLDELRADATNRFEHAERLPDQLAAAIRGDAP